MSPASSAEDAEQLFCAQKMSYHEYMAIPWAMQPLPPGQALPLSPSTSGRPRRRSASSARYFSRSALMSKSESMSVTGSAGASNASSCVLVKCSRYDGSQITPQPLMKSCGTKPAHTLCQHTCCT